MKILLSNELYEHTEDIYNMIESTLSSLDSFIIDDPDLDK
jgi:hypothetical protein